MDSNHRPHSPQKLVLNRLFYWDDLLLSALYQLSYTTYHIYLSLIQAAGSHTSLRHTTQSPSALLDLQSGFLISIRFACCCVTATIQPSIPTTSLGLILLPICSVCYCVTATVTHQPVVLSDSEITAHACFLFYGRTHSPLSCCLFPRHP